MERRFNNRLAVVVLAFALSAGTAIPVFADGSGTSIEQSAVGESPIGSVYITGNSYIEIKQASILAGEDGKTVAFTFSLHNEEDYELQLIDYWVRLVSDAGTSFSVSVLPQDKDKNRVPAHSSTDVTMVAKVNSETVLTDLSFRIIQWDFSAPNYERSLGTIAVPDDYSLSTPAGSARVVSVGGTGVKMAVTRSTRGQNEKYFLPKLQLSMENVGTKAAELPQYQFAIRTSEGLLYPLEAKGLEDKNRTVYPRFTKDVQLTGSLPVSVGPDGWELVVTTQADAGANNNKLTLPVAFFAVPAPSDTTDDSAADVGKTKNIDVGGQTLETQVKRVVKSKNDAFYAASMTFAMKNIGTGSVTIPAYRFAVQTADGLTYPAKTEGLKDLSVDPLVSKEIQLTASVPASVSAEGWKLVLLPPADANNPDSTSDAAIAVYKLSDSSQTQGSVGTGYEFTTKAGYYTAKLNGIQRLPWEDKDILSANLTIAGKSDSSLPVPAFAGYFLLDDSVRIPAKAIVKDNIISLKRGSELHIQLYGMVPYTNEYSTVKLVLQEQESDKAQTDLLEFRTDSKTAAIPTVELNGSYRMDGTGRQSSLSIRGVRTYDGVDANLFAVQLDVQNLEKRFTNVANLVAYFKAEDDSMYPAAITEIKKKVGPGGKATLYLTSPMPGSVNTDSLKLLVGFGVKDDKLAEGVEPDAYIDAVSFALPKENKEPKKDFKGLDLFPYTLSLSRFQAQVATATENGGTVTLGFDYQLSKNLLVESNVADHKLLLEFKDQAGNVTVSKSFELDKAEADGTLTLGDHRKTIVIEDKAIFYKLAYLDKYKVDVYDEWSGQKKLLASQTYSWGVTSE